MIHRGHHLHDDRLFDSYLAERRGETIDPPTAEHLADCHPCAGRYAEMVRLLEDVRAEGEAEADAIFTPERLRAQQREIARRLEAVARPARVISFPGQMGRQSTATSSSRGAPRWAAAAAAAGLFIGIALGATYEWESHGRLAERMTARDTSAVRDGRLSAVSTRGSSPADVAADDAFLSELEVALDRPRTRELMAFDALTPHVREVSQR